MPKTMIAAGVDCPGSAAAVGFQPVGDIGGATMPSHACIDLQDRYAQADLLFACETMDGGVRSSSALAASDEGIRP